MKRSTISFEGLLRKTPTHRYSEPVHLNIFINGLRPQSKQLLDASVGGKIKLMTLEEAMELTENMAASDHAILRDRAYTPTKRNLLELITQDATLAQNKLLTQQIEALTESFGEPRKTTGIQPREEFHTGLKLEESFREPIQQAAKKSTCPKFQPRG